MDKMLDQNREEFGPVSQSPIWPLVRSYYRQMGIKAWHASAVPNYITTNPFIASCYAKVIDGFFADFAKSRKASSSEEPFYIIELGAGTGRFGYCFLKHFFSELEMSIRANRNFVYVMTDISKANIEFWKKHPQLQHFIKQGVLDFAYLDVMVQEPIELLISGRILAVGKTSNPMAVIANYVFDSLPHDLFEIRNGRLRTRHIRCKLGPAADDISEIAKTTTIDYQDQDCAKNYYCHRGWNALLDEYRTQEKNLNFAIPVGGLTAIDKMSSLTTGPMFMIASDFGDSDMSAIRSLPKRRIATNGCYSVRVNFHAVSKYLEQIGGKFYAPEFSKSSLETVGLVTNLGKSKYKNLSHAFQTHIRDVGPDEFFMLTKVVERNFYSHNVQNIIGLLRISHWDTKIFCGCAPALMESLEKLDPWQKRAVIQVLCNVDDMYFRYDNTVDPSIVIIDMLLTLGEHKRAQEMFCKNEKFLRQTATGKIEADRLRAAIN